MRAKDNRVINKDGEEVSKTTGKAPQKKGFAINRGKINKGGRPKGARNKSTLVKAQLDIDVLSAKSVKFLQHLLEGNNEKLGLSERDEIPLKLRLDAAKELLNKAIANEKSKPSDMEQTPEKEDTTPIFQLTPPKQQNSN